MSAAADPKSGVLLQEESFQYQIYPRIDKLACTTDSIGGGVGPTAQAQRRLLQSNAAAKLGLVCIPPPCPSQAAQVFCLSSTHT